MAWNEASIKRILANPYYCLRSIDERLFGEHEPLVSEEEFIQAATRSIREQGAETYLKNLLKNLKGNFVNDTDGSAFAYRQGR